MENFAVILTALGMLLVPIGLLAFADSPLWIVGIVLLGVGILLGVAIQYMKRKK